MAKCLCCESELVNGHCANCNTLPCPQYYVGKREGALKDLINDYKYKSVRAGADALAGLLADCVDLEDLTVIPLPTIGAHIRKRGFDHIALLARRLVRIKS